MLMWIIILSLLVIGLALLIVEVIFIPGTTIVGLLGVGFSVVGVVVAYRNLGDEAGFYILMGTLAATGLGLYFSFRSGAWKRFALKSSITSKVNEGVLDVLSVGEEGITVSSLRPSGKAEFQNKHFEVRTTGNFLNPQTKIKIIQIEGNQIVVEQINN